MVKDLDFLQLRRIKILSRELVVIITYISTVDTVLCFEIKPRAISPKNSSNWVSVV